jgi:hypothetical protein
LHLLLVEHRAKRRAAVERLPDTARCGADVERRLAAFVDGRDRRDATVPLSTTAAPGLVSGIFGVSTLSGGPATITRETAPVGIVNQLSSALTLTSARSTVTRKFRDSFLPPLSTENGIQTPATCW